jgi:polysaccharide biosynthesis protein VpsQ
MGRLAILFGLLLALIIVGADTRNLGPLYWVYDFPNGDKVGHFLLYGGLTLLTCLAVIRLLPDRPAHQVALMVACAITVIATLEEFSQFWIASRTPDARDLIVGYLGIAVFGALALGLQAILPPSSEPVSARSRTDV